MGQGPVAERRDKVLKSIQLPLVAFDLCFEIAKQVFSLGW